MSKFAPPSRYATYRGDARGNRGLVVGPNTFGEALHIVSERYDPATNTTRVGFAYGALERELQRFVPGVGILAGSTR